MSFNHNLNLYQITNKPQLLLSNKYSNSITNYQKMKINLLIYSIPSHYYTQFKDLNIWNNFEENLKRYYQNNKSRRKIPMKAIYYKNYLKFFCRPFMWNLNYDKILQEYINQKAKTFYKQVYGNIHNQPENYFEEHEIDISKQNFIKESNKAMNTIFDSSARKVIDNNLATTLDIDEKEICDNDLRNNAEEFFTLGAKNDFLIDLLTNLSNKKNQRNITYFGLNSRLLSLAPTSTMNEQGKTTTNTINKKKIIPSKKNQIKSSYCNIYKQNNFQFETKQKINNKCIVLANKSIKDTRPFYLHSPKYQINSNYSEFKKYNSQSKSKSKGKSKGKKSSFKGKSFNYLTEAQRPQYTSYNKSNCFKYSIDNKSAFKSPTEKNRRPSLNKDKGELIKKKTLPNKTKHNINPKEVLSPNISNNLLISYLNNCSNSRQTKRKWENYFSVRNISNDKAKPSTLNQGKNKSNYQHSSQTNSNHNIANTAHNIENSNVSHKEDKQKLSICTHYYNGMEKYFNKKENNHKQNIIDPNIHQYGMMSPTPATSSVGSSGLIKEIICKNQSHSSVVNDKAMYPNNTTEIVKLINSIKKNHKSNKISNDLTSKNNKSTKHNDSSQTSSNTHQGQAHSKSPKVIDKTKDSAHNQQQINNNIIIKYTTKSTKHSRRSSPGNYVSMFSSQRK